MTLNSQSGNIIFSLLIAVMISSGSLFFYYSNKKMADDQIRHLISINNLGVIKASALSVVYNHSAVLQMQNKMNGGVHDNGNLCNCLTNPAFDCPNIASPLIVFSSDGSLYIGTEATEGFKTIIDSTGNYKCNTYSTSDVNCPYKYEFTWTPVCPPIGPCLSPDIEVKGRLKVDPGLSKIFLINVSKFDIDTIIDNR